MKRIAIVDDSSFALKWARTSFEERGYEIVTHNGPAGVPAFVRMHEPDVLLLDVQMPALNGDFVCEALRARGGSKEMVVLLYSALSDDELAERARECGADGFIRKSGDADAVCRKLEQELARIRGA